MIVYILKFIGYLFQFWVAMYLVLPSLYLIIFYFNKFLGRNYDIKKLVPQNTKEYSFAAIITAHQDLSLVPPLVDSLLKQTYQNVTIYLVADDCKLNDFNLEENSVIFLKPEKSLHSKIKSIDYAIKNFQKEHDSIVIFDSDNLVHPNYFKILNRYFQQGYKAVQTNLQPKNTDSLYARLDTIGDTYYNFTEREIRMEMGFSSAIWGLGIAIETQLYKDIIYDNFLGGFDKRIQADIVLKIPQLAFAKEAIVFDEKINSGKALEIQRTRWINAYFKYMKLGWLVFQTGIRKLNLNLAFFGLINLRPPLFINILFGFIFVLINFFYNKYLFYAWLLILCLYIISFIYIIIIKIKDKKIIKSLLFIPLFMVRQIFALSKIKKANKSFLKTEHSKLIYIEDLIKYE